MQRREINSWNAVSEAAARLYRPINFKPPLRDQRRFMPRYRDRTRRYPVREHLARPFCMHPAISIAPQIPRSSFCLFYESQDAADFALKLVQICPNCHFCDYTTSFCTLCSSYLYQILCVFVVARPLSFLHPSPLEFGQICPNRITHLPNSLIARLFFASFDLECRDSQSKSYRSPPDSTCVWLHDPLLHSLAFVEICSNRITLYQILHDSHLYRFVQIISLPNFMHVCCAIPFYILEFVQICSIHIFFLVEFVQICPNPTKFCTILLWSCEFFQDRATRYIFHSPSCLYKFDQV